MTLERRGNGFTRLQPGLRAGRKHNLVARDGRSGWQIDRDLPVRDAGLVRLHDMVRQIHSVEQTVFRTAFDARFFDGVVFVLDFDDVGRVAGRDWFVPLEKTSAAEFFSEGALIVGGAEEVDESEFVC